MDEPSMILREVEGRSWNEAQPYWRIWPYSSIWLGGVSFL